MKEASKLTNNKVVEVVVALSWELSAWTVSPCVRVLAMHMAAFRIISKIRNSGEGVLFVSSEELYFDH